MGKIYSTKYRVPFYHSDAKREMTIPAILNVALQISGEQSTELGRSEDWVSANYNLAWIVTEYEIVINRLPKFLECMFIETEAISYNKFFCYRDFRFLDEDKNLLLKIHSTWVLMDPDTRKANRVDDEIVAPYESEKVGKLERGHKFAQLEEAEKRSYSVRYSDIDMNQHVNNSRYYDWAVDPLGFDFLTNHQPEKIYIKYNHEVRAGEEISSSYSFLTSPTSEKTTCHAINDGDAQIEIDWKEIK